MTGRKTEFFVIELFRVDGTPSNFGLCVRQGCWTRIDAATRFPKWESAVAYVEEHVLEDKEHIRIIRKVL